MEEKINKALNIIITFDWGWRMEDSNYSQNFKRAQSRTKDFMDILKEIDDMDTVEVLRDIWIAHYDLSQPYMDSEYYTEKKEALQGAEKQLIKLLNNLKHEQDSITAKCSHQA